MMLSMEEITQFTALQALSGLPSLLVLAVFTDFLRIFIEILTPTLSPYIPKVYP